MKEMEARLAIACAQDLNAGEKLTLIMLLTRLDWNTWEGRVSVRDLSEVTAQSERNIKRQLKSVTDKGWITRHAERREDGLHHKALIKLNQGMVSDCHHSSDRLSPQVVTDCHHSSDKLTPQVVTDCPVSSDRLSPKSIDQYNINIDQYNYQPSDQHAEPELKPNPTREDSLEAERRAALQAGCKLIALSEDMGNLLQYRIKIDEVARFKGRSDIRLALAEHDAVLAKQAHNLRVSPASIVTYVEHLANTQRAPQSLIRR
jgi:hypothetical protein